MARGKYRYVMIMDDGRRELAALPQPAVHPFSALRMLPPAPHSATHAQTLLSLRPRPADLRVNSCTLTRFFRTLEANDVILGQAGGLRGCGLGVGRAAGGCRRCNATSPSLRLALQMSLCQADGSRPTWPSLQQRQQVALRATAFVGEERVLLRIVKASSVSTRLDHTPNSHHVPARLPACRGDGAGVPHRFF